MAALPMTSASGWMAVSTSVTGAVIGSHLDAESAGKLMR